MICHGCNGIVPVSNYGFLQQMIPSHYFLKAVIEMTETCGHGDGGKSVMGSIPSTLPSSRLVRATAVAKCSKQEVVLQVISQLNITPGYTRYIKG